jgi:hypothetical protein
VHRSSIAIAGILSVGTTARHADHCVCAAVDECNARQLAASPVCTAEITALEPHVSQLPIASHACEIHISKITVAERRAEQRRIYQTTVAKSRPPDLRPSPHGIAEVTVGKIGILDDGLDEVSTVQARDEPASRNMDPQELRPGQIKTAGIELEDVRAATRIARL